MFKVVSLDIKIKNNDVIRNVDDKSSILSKIKEIIQYDVKLNADWRQKMKN